MTPPNEITLATLDQGALMECASIELRKICENIADPNFDKKAKRKLQITIEIKPDAKGHTANLTYGMKSSMPNPVGGQTVAYIAMAPGSKAISLFEMESQPPLFEEEEPGIPRLAPAREA